MSKSIQLNNESGIARITIDRPAVKNAITFEMAVELARLLTELGRDAETRVVVLQGNGSDFSSGGDLSDIGKIVSLSPDARAAESRKSVSELVVPIFRAFGAMRRPVIAAVRGHAIGVGLQLALAADIVVASETARFSAPQVRLAHTLDHGESYSLPRKVGFSRAMQMALLGETWDAATAERFGLVNFVTEDNALEAKTDEIATCLATGATLAIEGMKALLRASAGHTAEEQLAAEREQIGVCSASEDFLEAMTAFGEKRKPRYIGR